MIGLLPAAGKAERIHGLPKYLLPVGDSYLLDIHVKRMQAADVSQVYIGANAANCDLLNHYSPFATVVYEANPCETMSETILATAETGGEIIPLPTVLFGMPDTYFEDEQVYVKLTAALDTASVAVAVFELRPMQYRNIGCVRIEDGRITKVLDKPTLAHFIRGWGALAWRPEFWQYLDPRDAHVGFAVQRAIEAGVDVRAVYCEGDYWDCGTPDEYFECIRSITGQGERA